MNQTLKKGIILLSIYLVILALLLLAPGLALNLFFSKVLSANYNERYVEVVSNLADLDSCNSKDRSAALTMRDALSDSLIDSPIMSMEFSYLFYSPNQTIPFQNGTYARVCREDENGDRINYNETFALVDLEKLTENNADLLEALVEFTKQDISGFIQINEYAMDGYECYPLSITLYNYNEVLKTLKCNENLDTIGMPISTPKDVWMNTTLLADKLSYLQSSYRDCRKQLDKIKGHYNYSVQHSENKTKVTPFSATSTFVTTKDGYGLLSISKLHTERLLSPVRLFSFIGWTVIMGIVSAIVLLYGRNR